MTRGIRIALLAATLSVALVAASPAGSANECDGLQVCVPVAGPWVSVPSSGGPGRPGVSWQLICPRGYIVGGLDAELTHRAIDLSFLGMLGQPGQPRHHDVALGDIRRNVRGRIVRSAELQAVRRLHARAGRRLASADIRIGVPAGTAGHTAREDRASASRKRHRDAVVPYR